MEIFCRDTHGTNGDLCTSCHDIFSYARMRIDRCPFKADKAVCSDCQVHCFQEKYREKIKTIMRFAGPKMPLRHPLLALRHVRNKIMSKRKFKK